MGSVATRFGLVFYSDTANAEKGMLSISKRLEGMHAALMGLDESMRSAFTGSIKLLSGLGSQLVGTASKLEKSKQMVMFAFRDMGEGALKVYDDAIEAGLRSVQTTDELINSVTLMKRMGKVNVLDPDMPDLFIQGTNQAIKFIDVLGDIASINPYGMEGAAFGIAGMLSGDWQAAKMRLDMSTKQVDEYKKAMAGANTQQDKLRAVAPLLARDFGGAAAFLADTWGFQAAQLSDVKDKLFDVFGQPLMGKLKGPVKEFVSYWVGEGGLLREENIHKLDGLKQVFADIGDAVATGARWAMRMGKSVVEFVRVRPAIVKFALAAIGLVGAFAGMVSLLIALKVGIAAVTFAFSGLFTAVLPLTALVGGLAVGAVYLAKWVLGGKSLVDTWHRVTLVIGGAWEMISTMQGEVSSLSLETGKALADKGLLGVTIRIAMLFHRIKRFFSGFADGFRQEWGNIKKAFVPVAQAIDKVFGGLRDAATSSTDKWTAAGVKVAEVVSKVIQGVAFVLEHVILALPYVVKAFDILWTILKGIASVLGSVGGWLMENKEAAIAIGGALGAAYLGVKGAKAVQSAKTGLAGAMGKYMGATPVYVVNMGQSGLGPGGGAAGGSGKGFWGKVADMAKKGGKAGGAGAAALGIGSAGAVLGTFAAALFGSQMAVEGMNAVGDANRSSRRQRLGTAGLDVENEAQLLARFGEDKLNRMRSESSHAAHPTTYAKQTAQYHQLAKMADPNYKAATGMGYDPNVGTANRAWSDPALNSSAKAMELTLNLNIDGETTLQRKLGVDSDRGMFDLGPGGQRGQVTPELMDWMRQSGGK